MVKVLEFFKTPQAIEALEGELLEMGGANIPVKHMVVNGVYARQITMPRGILAIGHAHTEACLNIVTAGSVSVLIDGEVRRISAPAMFASPPMDRKIGYVHDDATWITVHASREHDQIEPLEEVLIAKSPTYRRYEIANADRSTSVATCVRDEHWEDRLDYFVALQELGVSHETASSQSRNTEDCIPFPDGSGNLCYIGSSRLHGNGMFASYDIESGREVGPARIFGKRTPLGRYTNHAKKPNCEFKADRNGDIFLVSTSKISKEEELTVDYRQAYKVTIDSHKTQANLIV